MKTSRITGFACATATLLFMGLSSAWAQPMLTLSSPSNVNNLVVGQPFTINVGLSGLTAGQQLQTLSATVAFPPGQFANPASLTLGPIVPSGLPSPTSVQTSVTDPGFVDVLFDVPNGTAAQRISSNGNFFSFSLTPTRAGSGTISFDLIDALQFNLGSPGNPIDPGLVNASAAGLRFTASPAGSTVPLPPSAAVAIPALVALAFGGMVARRRQALAA